MISVTGLSEFHFIKEGAMRFHAAITTLMFAGVLAATPQLAAAAGCLGYNAPDYP